ncbi:MAG: oligosaccharide flippase family protein [Cytophagales bacterium]
MLIKNLFKDRLLRNFISMSTMLGVSYAVQFATIPYLFKTLGAEIAGVINLALTVTNIFINITDFGYYVTGTKEIAEIVPNRVKTMAVFKEIVFTKMLLTIIALPGYIVFVQFGLSPFYREFAEVFYGFYIWLIVTQLFPMWLLQGLQDNKFLSASQSGNRIAQFVLIFLFVKKDSPPIIVPAIYVFTTSITVIATYYYIKKRHHLMPKGSFGFLIFVKRLKSDFNIFISNFLNNIYSTSSVLVLSYFIPASAIGWFSVCDKLILGLRQICSIALPVLMPKSVRLLKENNIGDFNKLMFTSTVALLVLYLLFYLFFNFFHERILHYLFNSYNSDAFALLNISSLILIAVTLQLKPYIKKLALDNGKNFKIYYAICSVFYFTTTPALCYFLGTYGACIGIIATEFLILFFLNNGTIYKDSSKTI